MTAERYAHMVGWGMYVPPYVLTNDELARWIDTSDDWILSHTCIKERRLVTNRESTFTLALRAAEQALDVADLAPEELDMIIVATSTPEYSTFPATACLVQDALGAKQAGAFDLAAACTGFVYAVSLATHSIRCGATRTALIIGAETLSRIVNWEDRNTCVLFGDGAGAVVLRASEQPGGVLSTYMRSDGSGGSLLQIPGGGSRHRTSFETLDGGMHTIHMDGREVYRFASRAMANATKQVMAEAGVDADQLALVIPHQANLRIIQSAARMLGMPADKFFVNIERYGNTSTASIPIALCEAVEQGRLKPNDHMVLVAFGGGLTWGATLVQWGVTPAPATRLRRIGRRAGYALAWLRSQWTQAQRRAETVVTPGENGTGEQKQKQAAETETGRKRRE